MSSENARLERTVTLLAVRLLVQLKIGLGRFWVIAFALVKNFRATGSSPSRWVKHFREIGSAPSRWVKHFREIGSFAFEKLGHSPLRNWVMRRSSIGSRGFAQLCNDPWGENEIHTR